MDDGGRAARDAGVVVPANLAAGEPAAVGHGFTIDDVQNEEDIFSWMDRVVGGYDHATYCRLLGAANPFKDGDAAQGLAAGDDDSRRRARLLLARTTVGALIRHPVHTDAVSRFADAAVDPSTRRRLEGWSMGALVRFLLDQPEAAVKDVMPGLPSDVIACAVKLMSDQELIAMGQKVFNPLPGSKIGAKGYMGARVQPNSPTDDPDDILMQVLDGFAYAVGDVVLGTNPVSSDVDQVARVELALQDVVRAFGLEEVLPHCVLAHIDVQAEVERRFPGSTAVWFQSLGGVADANAVFNIDVAKMVAHARSRTGRFGLYFETGQGADATNGHGKGFDMAMHESRNYGFARALEREVAAARAAAGQHPDPWVHVNDVAGFIGPEVFRTRSQLVRVCLEDIVMGKLHGLTIGLDVCSTLHMEVTLDDLDACLEEVLPANPAYLMALPTKNDPMLSYLTTAYQDHVRVRRTFGYRVNDPMWEFFGRLGVIDEAGEPTARFGDLRWVYRQYRRAKGDTRPDGELFAEADEQIARVRSHGVFLATGHGPNPWDLAPELDAQVRDLYADAKRCIRAELPRDFASRLAPSIALRTRSRSREDYVLHPSTGESLDDAARLRLDALRGDHGGRYDALIVVSDGLNACALTDDGHLGPYLAELRRGLAAAGWAVAPEHLVVTSGRVRAGYRIGEALFAALSPYKTAVVVHVIGERPGNGHHTFSAYVTKLPAAEWAQPGLADHNHTRVISNIADTAFAPLSAARETVALLG